MEVLLHNCFPNANKTILKETKIYLLIKGHFQMEF